MKLPRLITRRRAKWVGTVILVVLMVRLLLRIDLSIWRLVLSVLVLVGIVAVVVASVFVRLGKPSRTSSAHLTLQQRRANLGLCPTCGYDLTGLGDGAVCPECGDESDR